MTKLSFLVAEPSPEALESGRRLFAGQTSRP